MAFWMGSGPCLFEGVVSASDVLASPYLFLSPLVACHCLHQKWIVTVANTVRLLMGGVHFHSSNFVNFICRFFFLFAWGVCCASRLDHVTVPILSTTAPWAVALDDVHKTVWLRQKEVERVSLDLHFSHITECWHRYLQQNPKYKSALSKRCHLCDVRRWSN